MGTQKGARYEYRADGMRAKKVEGLTIAWNPGDELGGSGYYDEIWAVNKPTTRYYYDGQMCVEEDYTYDNGGTPGMDLTRYGVGARGIDLIERVVNGGSPSLVFPLYDGHGNMTATLSRSGASFTVSNQRSYDVWGGVRSGATSGFPNTRYVANLGHKQDDESDLIYMRARYYEPWTGRFISEDPARDGGNWYVYARNDPLNYADSSGKEPEPLSMFLWAAGFAAVLASQAFAYAGDIVSALHAARYAIVFFALAWSSYGILADPKPTLFQRAAGGAFSALMNGVIGMPWIRGYLSRAIQQVRAGSYTAAAVAIHAVWVYSLVLIGAMLAMDYD